MPPPPETAQINSKFFDAAACLKGLCKLNHLHTFVNDPLEQIPPLRGPMPVVSHGGEHHAPM